MAAIKEPPTLLFVHGGSHGHPAYASRLRDEANKAGIPFEIYRSPSDGGYPTPGQALREDTVYWREKIAALADEGKDIVLLMHSLGSLVGIESAQGLDKSTRQKNGLLGGVVHMIFMAAYLFTKGQSVFDFYGDSGILPTTSAFVTKENGVTVSDLKPFSHCFYKDLPEEERKHWESYLSHVPAEIFTQPITHETWKDVPCSWIITEKDEIILPEVQKKWIREAKENHGVEIKSYSVNTDHSPFLTIPDRVIAIVKEIYKTNNL
ncbi:Alpha/Beta hydrolase protein [Xylogone sp. PMI_703]|nr:Alpha/Beta hydrolase protein [Xylogone sp. PMI_703]